MRVQRIPPATVARLPIYAQSLKALAAAGVRLASSNRLAEAAGVEAPQIRRDLACLGAFGTPGVGYDVEALLNEISKHLGLSSTWPVALVGPARLSPLFLSYLGVFEHNFRILAIFDNDAARAGTRFGDLEVMPTALITPVVKSLGIGIAIIASPPPLAQEAADKLVLGGVTSILSLGATPPVVPSGVAIRSINLAAEMLILSFHETMKRSSVARWTPRPAMRRVVWHGQKGKSLCGSPTWFES